ncbi:MAG: Ig-like domain-containing protein, partial [Sphingopyxis sp.]|nr:Ig-like domain-containing protein [Sphingopyxis sp.]
MLPAVLPNGTVGIFYSAILTTDGGTAPYRYSVTSGTLPTGLTLNAGGTLSGTPLAAQNFTFTIQSQDSSAAPGPYATSRSYTVTIAAPTIELTPVALPPATVNTPYNQVVTADGSVGPYSFAVTSGSLPPGITLAPDGTLSGTPTRGGRTGFTITATDATAAPGPYLGARAYELNVEVPALVLPPTTLPDGATDTAYSARIASATGGVGPYSYAVTSGELPFGLTMSATGEITGTPSTARLYNFVVTATDSNIGTGPTVVQQSYSINIVNTPPVTNPVSATVAYGAGLTPIPLSINGAANSVAIVSAPTRGRAIVDRMTISYIPDTGFAGSDSFTYIASNNGAASAPALVTINVQNPVITITAGGPLTASAGTPYSETFTFNGGAQPFSGYQITGLPAGLQSGSSGVNTISIVGTPTIAGNFPITVSATDSSTGNGPFIASETFTLVIDGPSLSMTPGAGTLTAPYAAPFSQTFVANGGVGPITYSLTGTLPAGLSFSGNRLSGTATQPGSYPVTVTATDTGSTGAGSPFTIAQNYTINVPAPAILIAPPSLATGTVGTSYNQTVSATGGVAPYGYAVTAGTLPPGVTLSTGGVLSGTPTAGGTFSVTLTATDANGQGGSGNYSITIGAAVMTLPPTTFADGQVGVAYNAALNTASGGTAPYRYAVSAGALPGGVSLSANGTLSGTPTAFGTFAFSVTATDSSTGDGPYAATQSYSLRVIELAPVANPVSATVAYGSNANAIALNIGGGAATSVTIVSAPSRGTAVVSGTGVNYTPNAGFAGTDSFTYTATGGGGTSAAATVTLSVGNPPFTIAAGNPLTTMVAAASRQTFT